MSEVQAEQMPSLVEQINRTIAIAILHGGDPGGPYFCETEEMEQEVNRLAEMLNCDVEWILGICHDFKPIPNPDWRDKDWPWLVERTEERK